MSLGKDEYGLVLNTGDRRSYSQMEILLGEKYCQSNQHLDKKIFWYVELY